MSILKSFSVCSNLDRRSHLSFCAISFAFLENDLVEKYFENFEFVFPTLIRRSFYIFNRRRLFCSVSFHYTGILKLVIAHGVFSFPYSAYVYVFNRVHIFFVFCLVPFKYSGIFILQSRTVRLPFLIMPCFMFSIADIYICVCLS